MTLRDEYQARFDEVLKNLAAGLEGQLRGYLEGEVRVDRIQARPKSVDRFVAKAEKVDSEGKPKYEYPLFQIQDQIGARITIFYLSDVDRISEFVERYYRVAEGKMLVPESEWEFSYFGKHYVLLTPTDLINDGWAKEMIPTFFELQIKTLFQHAWSEANHDMGYKPGAKALSTDDKRRLAFTSAQAWGADHIFDELFQKSQA